MNVSWDIRPARLSGRTDAGRTQAEVLAVFFLLLLLGVGLFTLSTSGSATYGRMEQARSSSASLRVALSFVQMKVHQTDVAGRIRIAPNPVNGNDSLVLTEMFDGVSFETWLYFDSGYLREALVLAGESFDNSHSFEIAALDKLEFVVNEAGSGVVIRAGGWDGRNQPRLAQTSLAIRSGGVR